MKAFFYLSLLLTFLLGQTLHAQEFNKEMAHNTSLAYLNKLTDLKKFNGVVLLKKGKEEIVRQAFNQSADSTSTLYVTTESQFDLRSVAKLFAKASLLQLEQQGLLNRNDLLSKYLPELPYANRVRIQQLIDHRSGLPREFSHPPENQLGLSPEKIIDLAKEEVLEFEPGTDERYSNVGYQLLYYLIGKISNTSFQNYLEDAFFAPLNMVHSGSHFDDPNNSSTTYAYGHYRNASDSLVCECAFPLEDLRLGNLYSTVDDLDRFLNALEEDLYQPLIHEGSISHAGGTKGKRAYVERNFEENYTLIFLSNYDDIPFQQLVADLQAILRGETVTMPKAIHRTSIAVDPSLLEKYTGTYDVIDAGHLLLTLKLENGHLYLYQKGQNNGRLYAETETVFFGDPSSGESIEFIKNDLGVYEIRVDFKGIQWIGTKVE